MGEAYYRQATKRPALSPATQPGPQLSAASPGPNGLDALGVGGAITIISNACASGTMPSAKLGIRFVWARRSAPWRAVTTRSVNLFFRASPRSNRSRRLSAVRSTPGAMVWRWVKARRCWRWKPSSARAGAMRTILGELIGYGTFIDQHHLTQPHPQGDTALAVMKRACAPPRLRPRKSTTSTLTAPARRSTTSPRPLPSATGLAPAPPLCRSVPPRPALDISSAPPALPGRWSA